MFFSSDMSWQHDFIYVPDTEGFYPSADCPGPESDPANYGLTEEVQELFPAAAVVIELTDVHGNSTFLTRHLSVVEGDVHTQVNSSRKTNGRAISGPAVFLGIMSDH